MCSLSYSEEHLAQLSGESLQFGCQQLQAFLFQKPLSSADATHLDQFEKALELYDVMKNLMSLGARGTFSTGD